MPLHSDIQKAQTSKSDQEITGLISLLIHYLLITQILSGKYQNFWVCIYESKLNMYA